MRGAASTPYIAVVDTGSLLSTIGIIVTFARSLAPSKQAEWNEALLRPHYCEIRNNQRLQF